VTLPAERPTGPVSVVALAVEGAPSVNGALVQQPGGMVHLPAHVARLTPPPETTLKFGPDGAVTGWLRPGGELRWQCRLRAPGRFRVVVLTTGHRGYRRSQFGTHTVRVAVGGATVTGRVGMLDLERVADPDPYVVIRSEVGTVTVARVGDCEARLEALEIEPVAAGLSVCGVRLEPCAEGAEQRGR